MSLSSPFVRRPVGTLLLTIGIALAGITAFFALPVAPLPQVDFPTVSIQAPLPGGSPTTMATSVASPLERRLGTIADVSEMTSQSGTGSTRVTLQFNLGRDINGAARDVQGAINAARADLPSTLKNNPTYRKVNPADAPIMILALTSRTRTPAQVYDAVSSIVQQKLAQVSGVGDVELGGGSLPAVRVELNMFALNRLGISLDSVRQTITASNGNRPKGALDDGSRRYQIYTNPQDRVASAYSNLVIAYRNGAAVHLSDVARVYDGPEDRRTLGLFNGRPAVVASISRQPDANIIATADGVTALLPELRAQLPADIEMAVAIDRTRTIRASLHEVEITLLVSTLLVVLVVSIFLRSLRATIVPAVAVTVSLLGTFAIMYALGFSLNNLSLMALTVATGFVVDDAIVVLENITRHIEKGKGRMEAALLGAREVGFTVLTISLSLIAVFIPLLFMGGIVGRLFREFAITLSASVLISLVISLTTTPMICAWLLDDGKVETQPGRISRWLEASFDRIQDRYARSLDWALGHATLVMVILAATVAFNVYLFVKIPKGFFPQQETGQLQGGLRADQSVSFQAMQGKLQQIIDIVRKDPAVDSVVGFTGGARAGGGFLSASLKRDTKDKSADVLKRLRPKLSRITGVGTFLTPAQDIRVGGRQSNSAYQYTLKSDDTALLTKSAQALTAALKADPTLTDVDSDSVENAVEAFVTVDRDAASRLGVTSASVDAALYNAFGQRQVATIYSALNQYKVIMEVAPADAQGPDALRDIYVPSTIAPTGAAADGFGTGNVAASGLAAATGSAAAAPVTAVSAAAVTMVPLSALASVSMASSPSSVNHQDGAPATTISFNLAPGRSLSDAKVAIADAQARLAIPANVRGSFQGTAKVFEDSLAATPWLVLAAIIVIYLLLGVLYESLIHPLTVLSTLPSAGVGAVLALLLFKTEFSIIALIGVILLIGIVKKNAILIIDFALEAERTRGLSPHEAIREASLLRFRPILMTTLAALLGAVPLAIGFGEGSELRQPLGIAIIGGLIVSQMLTLLTTPVVYLLLDRFRSRRPNPAAAALQPA